MKILRNAVMIGSLALLAGCNTTESNTNPDGSTKNNQTDATGQAATNILGTKEVASDSVMSAVQSPPTELGGRLDPAARKNLLDANQTYRSQLAVNPNDPVAGFGIAVTSLSLNADDLSDSLKLMFDKVDLGISGDAGSLFKSSPAALVKSQSFASRSFADPKKAPKISELQNLLETKLMPGVDSAILFLDKCWNTPNFSYRFAVHLNGKVDSMAIGRADVGFALAGLRTARAYFSWLLAQNVDCDFNGSYAWIDTMKNIDDSLGPRTEAQSQAFENLKTLLAPGSAFYAVRSTHLEKVNAIPAELVSIADLVKAAGTYSLNNQLQAHDGLVRLTADDNRTLARVMDSVKIYLSGFHTYTKEAHTETQYTYDSVCTYGTGANTYSYTCGRMKTIQYPGYSVNINVAKLITQPDHKVFLPKYSWNASSDWASKGAFSLTKGMVTTSMKAFDEMDLNGPKDLASYIEWADPTFGGVFAFKTSTEVLDQIDAMDEKPVTAGALTPNALF